MVNSSNGFLTELVYLSVPIFMLHVLPVFDMITLSIYDLITLSIYVIYAVQIMKPLICSFLHNPDILPFRSKYSPWHAFLMHLQSMFFPYCPETKLHSYKSAGKITTLYDLIFNCQDMRW